MARTKLVADPKAADQFQPGGVCFLRSGSCRMVVERILPDGTIVCVWQHYDTKAILRGSFDPVALTKVQG